MIRCLTFHSIIVIIGVEPFATFVYFIPTAKSVGSDSETVMLVVSPAGFSSAKIIVYVHPQRLRRE